MEKWMKGMDGCKKDGWMEEGWMDGRDGWM